MTDDDRFAGESASPISFETPCRVSYFYTGERKERRMPQINVNAQLQAGKPSKIVDYHLDECCEWIADLACGHQQYVRHNPPWTHRHWVTTPQGRYEHLGFELQCLACPAP